MPSSSAPDSGAPQELRRKLTWLTVFRTVATSLLMGAVAARLLSGPARELTPAEALSFGLAGAAYLLTLVHGIVLRQGWVGPRAAYGQVVGDVVLATSLVFISGGADSPFTFTYSVAVIAASIVLYERGALFAAALSSAAFAGLLLLAHLRWPLLPGDVMPVLPERVTLVITSHVLSQFLIAALASYLARRLSATTADLERLATLQRQILDGMPSGLITCGPEGQVTFINPAGALLLGLEPGAGTGEPVESLLPGVQALGGNARRRELVVPTRMGPRTLGLNVTPLEDRPGSLLVVFQDLTELRRMEDALQRSDALAALGKLSAQLAHEIRNPLAAMRGSAQMLAQDAPAGAPSARLTSILLREADRLGRLVEEFMRFARPPRPTLRWLPLAPLVEETVEMLRLDPLAAHADLQLALEPVEAAVDADQLRQVLINLLRNALQAVAPGGTVRVGLQQAGGRVQLKVWDSAGSISAQDLKRIFEPFVSTRAGGTGLGLSTAHAIVQAHGGLIAVDSNPEHGTEFTVDLPQGMGEVPLARTGS